MFLNTIDDILWNKQGTICQQRCNKRGLGEGN